MADLRAYVVFPGSTVCHVLRADGKRTKSGAEHREIGISVGTVDDRISAGRIR